MSLLLGLYVSALVVFSTHMVLNADWTTAKRFQGWELANSDGSLAFARDPTTCIAGCVLSYGQDCLAAMYSDSSRACRHFHKGRIRMKSSSSDDTTFIAKTKPVSMLYKEDVSFADAADLCKVFGGRLMNRTEALDYYKEGRTHCICTWISGETQVTISQPGSNNTCDDGVVTCPLLLPETRALCRLNV